jgi:hypothetical protein
MVHFLFEIAPELEQTGSDIAVDFPGAEDFGGSARGLPSPNFELEGAIFGCAVSLGEEEVVFVLGVDVVDPVLITDHFDGLAEA